MDQFNSDDIHMCRTCGVFYSNNFVRKLFNNPFDEVTIMQPIRLLLNAWKIEVDENDGRSGFVCTLCINEFERAFKFLDRCLEVHKEYSTNFIPQKDLIQVKRELPEVEEEEKYLGFIYIDDLSDNNDGQFTDSFDIEFKEEKIAKQRISPLNIKPIYLPNKTDSFVPFMLRDNILQDTIGAATIPFADMTNDNDKIKINDQQHNTFSIDNNNDSNNDDDIKVVKFTYDDDFKDTYTNSIDFENKPIVVGKAKEITTTTTTAASLTCKLCLLVAPDQAELREHFERIHAVKDFDCHICGKKFKNSTNSRLRYHLKWHKLNKHIQCVLCGFNCASRDILNEHKRAVHSKIECNICNKKIYAKRLKGHLRTHELTAASTLRCSICNEVFHQQNLYETHILLAHGNVMNSQNEILNSTDHTTTTTNGEELEQHLENKLSLQEGQFSSFNTTHSTIADESGEIELEENDESDQNNDDEDQQQQHNDEDYEKEQSDELNEDYENNEIQQQQQSQQQPQQKQSYAQFIQKTPPTYTNPHKEEFSVNDIVTTMINGAIFSVPKTPLKEHFNETTNQTYTCAQCTEWFTSVDDLIDHSEMHKKNYFKCELCDKSFDLTFKLNRHIRKCHKDDNKS